MSKKNNQLSFRLIFIISTIIFAAVVIWAVVKQQPAKQIRTKHHHQHLPFESFVEGTKDVNQPKISLNDVIKAARTWGPAYTSWFGQKAPDFTLTDITGKQHKLSDYRGKDVMLIFWATWCGPCLMELPHLITLRNLTSEDKLAMLAISYITAIPPNTAEMVKRFAEQKKINYPVFSVDVDGIPAPYNQIRGIPCNFFIDSEGKIKLCTEGLLSLGEIKAILQASVEANLP